MAHEQFGPVNICLAVQWESRLEHLLHLVLRTECPQLVLELSASSNWTKMISLMWTASGIAALGILLFFPEGD